MTDEQWSSFGSDVACYLKRLIDEDGVGSIEKKPRTTSMAYDRYLAHHLRTMR